MFAYPALQYPAYLKSLKTLDIYVEAITRFPIPIELGFSHYLAPHQLNIIDFFTFNSSRNPFPKVLLVGLFACQLS